MKTITDSHVARGEWKKARSVTPFSRTPFDARAPVMGGSKTLGVSGCKQSNQTDLTLFRSSGRSVGGGCAFVPFSRSRKTKRC